MAERALESYPFHPDLLDLMYHRWGSLPSYQRTRGALQFLACVVFDLWNYGRDLQPLIGPGDVPLEFDNTRNAFFTQVGEREITTPCWPPMSPGRMSDVRPLMRAWPG